MTVSSIPIYKCSDCGVSQSNIVTHCVECDQWQIVGLQEEVKELKETIKCMEEEQKAMEMESHYLGYDTA